MNDTELHAALEARGYVKEHTGGNCHAYRKGKVVITGADGDLPSLHWYTIGVWQDWHNSCESTEIACDMSDEYPDVNEPRDIWADIAEAERLAAEDEDEDAPCPIHRQPLSRCPHSCSNA